MEYVFPSCLKASGREHMSLFSAVSGWDSLDGNTGDKNNSKIIYHGTANNSLSAEVAKKKKKKRPNNHKYCTVAKVEHKALILSLVWNQRLTRRRFKRFYNFPLNSEPSPPTVSVHLRLMQSSWKTVFHWSPGDVLTVQMKRRTVKHQPPWSARPMFWKSQLEAEGGQRSSTYGV